MNLVFFISSVNTKDGGNGGHYYSLIETINNLQNEHSCEIINIGTQKSKALINQDFCTVTFFDSTNFSFFKVYQKVHSYLKNKDVDVIHAFDSIAYLWARALAKKIKTKLVLTKCGGANLVYYPYCSNLICYSLENYEFFKKSHKYDDTNLYLIPNRISEFNNDEFRIEKLNQNINKDHQNLFKILRVLRISTYYEASLMQLINLVIELNSEKTRCILIIIGTNDDQQIVDNIISMNLDFIYIFNNDYFTINAKEIIDYSDAVLGTGRSFMEAASKSKILFSPVLASKYPMLITQNNFDKAFAYNFSERILIESYNEKENLSQIEKVLVNEDLKLELKVFSKTIFNKYFNSNALTAKHNFIYFEGNDRKNNYLDFILNYFFVLRKHFIKA